MLLPQQLKRTLESAIEIMDSFYMAYDEAKPYHGRVGWVDFPVEMELNEFREYHLWYDGNEYSLEHVQNWKDLLHLLVDLKLVDPQDAALAEAI